MKKLLVTVIAAAVVPIAAPHATAHDVSHHSPFGFLCWLTSVSDPQVEGGSQLAAVDGGPMVIDEGETSGFEAGTMSCTVQVGTNDVHAEPNECRVTGMHGVGIISPAGGAGYCGTFDRGRDEDVYVCTYVDIDGHPRLYWDAEDESWTTYSGSQCNLVVTVDPPEAGPAEEHEIGIGPFPRSV